MEWKKIYINDEEINYSVSESGLLRNDRTGKIRKEQKTKSYIRYYITLGSKGYINLFAHRLVAEYFIQGDLNRSLSINHIDGNKSNNHYSNLEYVTNQENTDHAIRIGLFNPSEQTGRIAVNVYNRKGIFLYHCDSLTEASMKTGARVPDISEICKRKNGAKQSNGFQFRHTVDCDDIEDVSHLTSGIPRRVCKINKKTNEKLEVFKSIAEANRSLNKDSSSSLITQCCKGKCKTAYGFKWEYVL